MEPPTYEEEMAEHRAIVALDGEAFARWLTRSEDRLRRSLRSFARTVDTEAVVQETGLKVWANAFQVKPDGQLGFLLRWATTVARRQAIDFIRCNRLVAPPTDLEELPAPPAPPADPHFRKRIAGCLGNLTPKLAKAILARISSGGEVSDRELASTVGMTFDAFRQNLARARAALEKCLAGFGIQVRTAR